MHPCNRHGVPLGSDMWWCKGLAQVGAHTLGGTSLHRLPLVGCYVGLGHSHVGARQRIGTWMGCFVVLLECASLVACFVMFSCVALQNTQTPKLVDNVS